MAQTNLSQGVKYDEGRPYVYGVTSTPTSGVNKVHGVLLPIPIKAVYEGAILVRYV
jgi:hypothetical protein